MRSDVHRAAHRSDFVVVAWHWNQEYTTAPGWLQRSEGKAAINAGADIVFAHHPHVLQGVQAYHGGLICWSLDRRTSAIWVYTSGCTPSSLRTESQTAAGAFPGPRGFND